MIEVTKDEVKPSLMSDYKRLITNVVSCLRMKVKMSKIDSEFVNEKAVKVEIADYVELVILNDELLFLDRDGNSYSIHYIVNLEDLINLI